MHFAVVFYWISSSKKIDLSKTIDLLWITFGRRKTISPSHPDRTVKIVTPDPKSISDLYYPYRHNFL